MIFKIRFFMNKFVNALYFKLNHIEYESVPNINGRIKIVHDRYSADSQAYPYIKFGKNAFINSGKNKNIIGRGTRTVFRTINNGRIVIGDNLKISNSTLVSMEEIRIGDNVMIGGGVTIWDTDFHSLNFQTRIYNPFEDIHTGKIIIDDGAFIGSGSYILKGVRIGRESIIGAGSVVTCDVPEFEIWGGNPAKFIRRI